MKLPNLTCLLLGHFYSGAYNVEHFTGGATWIATCRCCGHEMRYVHTCSDTVIVKKEERKPESEDAK